MAFSSIDFTGHFSHAKKFSEKGKTMFFIDNTNLSLFINSFKSHLQRIFREEEKAEYHINNIIDHFAEIDDIFFQRSIIYGVTNVKQNGKFKTTYLNDFIIDVPERLSSLALHRMKPFVSMEAFYMKHKVHAKNFKTLQNIIAKVRDDSTQNKSNNNNKEDRKKDYVPEINNQDLFEMARLFTKDDDAYQILSGEMYLEKMYTNDFEFMNMDKECDPEVFIKIFLNTFNHDGSDSSSEKRRQALEIILYHAFRKLSNDGHSYMEIKDIEKFVIDEYLKKAKYYNLINFFEQSYHEYSDVFDTSRYFFVDKDTDEQRIVYLKSVHEKECFVARFIVQQRINSDTPKYPFLDVNIKTKIKIAVEALTGISFYTLTQAQCDFIDQILNLFFENKSSAHVLHGLPGTGKSFVINIVTTIAYMFKRHICLCAPTGKAAQRMGVDIKIQNLFKATIKSKTIHSALKPAKDISRLNKQNTDDDSETEQTLQLDMSQLMKMIKTSGATNEIAQSDFIIIDELSMLNLDLAYITFQTLVKNPIKNRIIIFVGDPNQIPSIGNGTILKSLIDSRIVPSTFLHEIKRQQEESFINVLARDVITQKKENVIQKIANKTYIQGVDVIINLQADKASDRVKCIEDLYLRAYEKYKDQCIIITPYRQDKHGMVLTSDQINKRVHNQFYPTQSDERFGEKERIMITKNYYPAPEHLIELRKQYSDIATEGYNGEMAVHDKQKGYDDVSFAKVKRGKNNKFLLVDKIECTYGHAATIHKMQGSDHPIVVIIAYSGHGYMLNKQMFYTAITRATERVVIIGDSGGIHESLKIAKERKSKLTETIAHFYAEEKKRNIKEWPQLLKNLSKNSKFKRV